MKNMWFKFLWFRAYVGFFDQREKTRLRRLQNIQASDGYKQIIIAQIANFYAKLEQKEKAIEQYLTALQSELSWGKRKNRQVSQYIILYCEYHALALSSVASRADLRRLEQLKQQIQALEIPDVLKKHYLPFPS